MAKKTVADVVVNGAVVRDTIKAYKAAIKNRRADLNKQYKALDTENDAIYKLEDDLRGLEDILRLSSILNKTKN